MAAREAYVRGHSVYFDNGRDIECHPGLEFRSGDDVDQIARELQRVGRRALEQWGDRHLEVARQVEEYILEHYPRRAYFIETEVEGRGVQVYQPFGMPRGATCIAHEDGCHAKPRTPRGCHCGADHQ